MVQKWFQQANLHVSNFLARMLLSKLLLVTPGTLEGFNTYIVARLSQAT